MARMILIHGAWGTGETWDLVAPQLRARGHDVTAVTLPGHGSGARRPGEVGPGEVGMEDYVAHVADLAVGGPPAMLVGYSMGGMVISAVAERVPDAVTKLVYVAALLPEDGDSLIGLIKRQDAPGIASAVRPGPIRGTTVLDPEAAAPILYPEANAAQRAGASFVAQPNRGQTDPVRLGPSFAACPRAYVFTRQDQVVTYALQQAMVAQSPCGETFTLDCGHVPQLTRAEELAAILDRL